MLKAQAEKCPGLLKGRGLFLCLAHFWNTNANGARKSNK